MDYLKGIVVGACIGSPAFNNRRPRSANPFEGERGVIDLEQFFKIDASPYVLRVRGDHPELHLADGDYVIVIRAGKAKRGDLVVGMDKSGCRLSKYDGSFEVTGRVIGMVRKASA